MTIKRVADGHRSQFCSAMRLTFGWFGTLANKIIPFGVLIIQKLLLRRRYIHQKSLFGVIYKHVGHNVTVNIKESYKIHKSTCYYFRSILSQKSVLKLVFCKNSSRLWNVYSVEWNHQISVGRVKYSMYELWNLYRKTHRNVPVVVVEEKNILKFSLCS